MFAICTAVILLLFTYVARLTVVDGESMMDTLNSSDYLIVQELGYTPTRGDIVVLQKMDAGYYQKPLIKRVIAVGGDTVDIDFETWTVYVNGEALDEPYCNLEGPTLTSTTELPLTVEEGKIFVMRDHRNHSWAGERCCGCSPSTTFVYCSAQSTTDRRLLCHHRQFSGFPDTWRRPAV